MDLKKLRTQIKMSQAEVAKMLNIAQTTYSAYETGKNSPDTKMLIKLADFFHVSVDTILGREFHNIDFSKLSETHISLMSKIANLNVRDCEIINGYIDGLHTK